MSLRRLFHAVLIGALCITPIEGVAAQVRLDRSDPTIIEQALPQPQPGLKERLPAPETQASAIGATTVEQVTGRVTAVTVKGADGVDPSAYADVIAPLIGRELSRSELTLLASAIGSIVRARGYPFATAAIEPQTMAGGVLRVSVDQGQIDAVRVVGARNAAADALLVRTLVNRRAITRGALERALMLVADLPGVRVKDTRYVKRDGFGILLVTIEQDRASAYVQVDNRGSKEVGPIRATALASVRGLVSDGDELGLVAASTPLYPGEFVFGRLRYSAPIDTRGSVLSVSGSYGRSHPGASLARLGVIGKSADVAVTYAHPLLRRRDRSLWGAAEFRAVSIKQTLRGLLLRDDRLATLTGSVNGFTKAAGGTLRGDISAVAGLPLPGVTHQGDARTSRPDGDGRFVTLGYQIEWAKPVAPRVNVVLASAGQVATRPLLATAELGLGGPAFGRGYDYAERTGDHGIMGSAEIRYDAGRLVPGVIDRAQLYGFVDGGTVTNLNAQPNGGTLASSGIGVRAGTGRLDGMVEVALPLNKDRFDTGDRRPRISMRLSLSL